MMLHSSFLLPLPLGEDGAASVGLYLCVGHPHPTLSRQRDRAAYAMAA